MKMNTRFEAAQVKLEPPKNRLSASDRVISTLLDLIVSSLSFLGNFTISGLQEPAAFQENFTNWFFTI